MNTISIALLALALAGSALASAKPEKTWLTMAASKIHEVKPKLSFAGALTADQLVPLYVSAEGIAVLALSRDETRALSVATHMLSSPSCPGYMVHDSYAEAVKVASTDFSAVPQRVEVSYRPTSAATAAKINALIEAVDKAPVAETNAALEAMGTRHSSLAKGEKVSKVIASQWQKAIGKDRKDVTFDTKAGLANGQNSIIMAIKGTEKPDEIVIVGGHLDSISKPKKDAPGADDDASGIASITGLIAAIGKTKMTFKRSLHFMGYSAEEDGLKGSAVIARQYADADKKVVGVLQLDMTGFEKNTPPALIGDYTSESQNKVVRALSEEFKDKIGLGTFSDSSCNYGCSDHASWSLAGYKASFIFETEFGRHNKKLHTPEDRRNLISDEKMANFSKFAAAFVVKLSEDAIVR